MDPLHPGDPRQVGPYRIEGRLGGGGMGQVFFGRSPGGRTVAVKLVRPELAGDAGFRQRFAAEVKAAQRVGGFFTAQVVDADPAADPPWLVTACVPGPSLQQVVGERGPLPADAVRALGAGLAEGLAAIHACGLVHRDLKPGNVLLADDGPRVIDFGIARALDATSMTNTGAVFGTPAFMSPEQGLGHAVGPQSDVFSLGSVLAYAATGQSPFGEGSPTAVIYRIVREEPDLTAVPAELRPIIASCLAKDPAQRPTVPDLLTLMAATGIAHRAGTGHPQSPSPTRVLHDQPAATRPRGEPPLAATATGALHDEIRFETDRRKLVQPLIWGVVAAGIPALLASVFTPFLLYLEILPVVWVTIIIFGIFDRSFLVVDATGLTVRKSGPIVHLGWDQITKIGAGQGPMQRRTYVCAWGTGVPLEGVPLCALEGGDVPRWKDLRPAILRYHPSAPLHGV